MLLIKRVKQVEINNRFMEMSRKTILATVKKQYFNIIIVPRNVFIYRFRERERERETIHFFVKSL